MKLMQKILSFIVLCSMFVSTGLTFAATPTMDELKNEIERTSMSLEEMKNGLKYKKMIDDMYQNHGNNKESIERLAKKLTTISDTLDERPHNIRLLLTYIIHKNNYYILQNESDASLLVDAPLFVVQKAIEQDVETEPVALSSTEKKEVNDKVISMQKNMFEKGSNMIQNMIDEYESYTNYEQKGRIDLEANINLGEVFQGESTLSLSDYEYRVSNFNSEFSGLVDAMLEWESADESFSGEFGALLDFISKDGNMYFLIENLKMEGFEDSIAYTEIQKVLEKIESQKKHVKFGDQGATAAYELLNSLDPKKLLGQGKEMVSKPMLVPYAKKGDKVILLPSKHACDTMKDVLKKFDPLNGSSCTDKQYASMLKDLRDDNLEIYMIMGDDADTLGVYFDEGSENVSMTTTFNNDAWLAFNLTALENGKNLDGEHIYFDYKKAKHLNMSIDINDESTLFKMTSTLNSNNKFKEIDFRGETQSFTGNGSCKLTLKDNVLSGGFISNSKRYDYDSGEYKLSNRLTGKITGATTSSGELSKFKLEVAGNDLVKQTQPLDMTLAYANNQTDLDFSYNTEGSKFSFISGGKWNSSDKRFDSMDIDLSFKTKAQEFDISTYEYSYSGDFQDNVLMNIDYANKKLNGKTVFSDKGELLMEMKHTGTIEKDYFDIQNDFLLPKELYQDDLYTDYESYGVVGDITGSLNFLYDTRSNKEKAKYYLKVVSGENVLVEVTIDADGTKVYKDIEIEEPDDYIESDELFPPQTYDNYNY